MKSSTAKTIAAIGLLNAMSNSSDLKAVEKPVTHLGIAQELLSQALRKHSRDYWTILEGLVVFDEILYDAYAFQRFPATPDMTRRLAHLSEIGLTPSIWPKEVYENTASAVRQLKEYGDQSVIDKETVVIKSFDHGEKRYHDDLGKTEGLELFSFAETQNTFERALFYAELGHHLGLHLLPKTQDESTFLEVLSKVYKNPHQTIQDAVKDYDIQMRPAEAVISAPPLAHKIAWTSITTGRSRLDVVNELRESDNARDYRRHIADLQGELNNDTVSSKAVEKIQKEFKKIVDVWLERGSRDEGVKYKTRNIRVQVLPIIAALSEVALHNWSSSGVTEALKYISAENVGAQAIFGNSIVVRDPILWGAKKYISFVADWYDYGAD